MAKVNGIVFFKDAKWGVKVFASILSAGEIAVTIVDGTTSRVYLVELINGYDVKEADDGTTSKTLYFTLKCDTKLPISARKKRKIAGTLVRILEKYDVAHLGVKDRLVHIYNYMMEKGKKGVIREKKKD